MTSISTALTGTLLAITVHASRVSLSGLTESATTVRPEAEVVLRDRVADAIARIIKRLADRPEVSDGLLNRVNAQIHRTELTSQFPLTFPYPVGRQE
jgi:hypothetical protein